MELLDVLTTRLEFVKYFYATSAHPFIEIKRKIEAVEEPYVDRRDPEWADEPAFLCEFENADLAAELVGVSALALVQSLFHAFLERSTVELGGQELLKDVSKMARAVGFRIIANCSSNAKSIGDVAA